LCNKLEETRAADWGRRAESETAISWTNIWPRLVEQILRH